MFTFLFTCLFKSLLIVIVIFSYLESTSKMQIISEAMARISAENSANLKTKWFNLLFMIPPQRSSSEDNSGLTMLDIFRYNLGQLNLNWLQIFWIGGNNEGSNFVTREEKVKQLQLYKKKVIEDKKHTLENFRFYKVRKCK